MVELGGRPIAITGASSGIGAAAALACARAGMPVALGARRTELLEQLASRIESEGGRAIAVACDVRIDEDCRELVRRTVDAFGSIYACFANAGYGFEAGVLDTSDEQFREILDVNAFGSLRLIRPAAAHMLERGEGHVLLCSSCLSKIGTPWYSAYSASKAFQDHIGRALRHELRERGIHVSTVHPIGTRTEFFEVSSRLSGGAMTDGRGERWTQPPHRVADAFVDCLRRPRPEVWTSLPVRLALAASVAAPGLADRLVGWALERRRE